MKRTILMLICIFFLSACYSTTPLTFVGDTAHWHIEMNATNTTGIEKEQKVSVTYKYKGSIKELNRIKHIELSFHTPATSGSQSIDTKNGLNKMKFTITTGGNGAKITKDTEPTATIVLGKNGTKETTKLIKK